MSSNLALHWCIGMCLLIIMATVGCGTCSVRSTAVFAPIAREVQFGKTPIEELYDLDQAGRSPLLAMLDPASKKVFVRTGAESQVMSLFQAKSTTEEGVWLVEHSRANGLYRLATLTAVSLKQPLEKGMLFALEKNECVPVAKDSCVNIYDVDTHEFLYSWKAVRDTEWCVPGDDTCVEIWQTNTVTVYPDEDCKGEPFESEEEWAFCVST